MVLAVIGILGWVVARSMQRQRDYERRLHERPDGIHGGRPADDADGAPGAEPGSGTDGDAD